MKNIGVFCCLRDFVVHDGFKDTQVLRRYLRVIVMATKKDPQDILYIKLFRKDVTENSELYPFGELAVYDQRYLTGFLAAYAGCTQSDDHVVILTTEFDVSHNENRFGIALYSDDEPEYPDMCVGPLSAFL